MKCKPYITLRDRTWKGKDWFSGNTFVRMLTNEEAQELTDIRCILKHFENDGFPDNIGDCKKLFDGIYLKQPKKKNSYTFGIKGTSLLDSGTELEAYWCCLSYYKSKGLIK